MTRRHGPTAVVIIYALAAQHLVEAAIILSSTAADSSIGIAAMFQATGDQRLALALTLVIAALLAIGAVRTQAGFLAIFALLPQQTLLAITAGGALCWAFAGHYADGYEPGGGQLFILADQLPRIIGAVAHAAAFYQWVWFNEGVRRTRVVVDNILAKAIWVSHAGDPIEDDLLVLPAAELRVILETNIRC